MNPPVSTTPFYHPYYGHMPFATFGGPTTPRYSHAVHPGPQYTPELVDEIDENVTLFPKIAAWLQELDNDAPCGHDGHNFAQYMEKLEAQMFLCILHVEKLLKDELIAICSMPIGMASMVCEYARKDCRNIRKVALKNLRECRLELNRYT